MNIGDLFAKVTKNADGSYTLVSPAEVYSVQAEKPATISATLIAQ